MPRESVASFNCLLCVGLDEQVDDLVDVLLKTEDSLYSLVLPEDFCKVFPIGILSFNLLKSVD